MKLNYNTVKFNYSENMECLIKNIDTQLSSMAKTKLDSSRYDIKSCVNSQLFNIILRYRRILDDKIHNEKYLSEYCMEDIVSRIKQLISSGKIFSNTMI